MEWMVTVSLIVRLDWVWLMVEDVLPSALISTSGVLLDRAFLLTGLRIRLELSPTVMVLYVSWSMSHVTGSSVSSIGSISSTFIDPLGFVSSWLIVVISQVFNELPLPALVGALVVFVLSDNGAPAVRRMLLAGLVLLRAFWLVGYVKLATEDASEDVSHSFSVREKSLRIDIGCCKDAAAFVLRVPPKFMLGTEISNGLETNTSSRKLAGMLILALR